MTKNKVILWIVAVIMFVCTAGTQISEFQDTAVQTWFTAISAVLGVLFASATLPKLGDRYKQIIRLLLQVLGKLFFLLRKKKKDENE